jgi:predicted enzyme related to lactoylglutathione lyase
MSADTLCWTDIPVTNLDRAIKFYSAVLRQEVRRMSEGGLEYGLLPHEEQNSSGVFAWIVTARGVRISRHKSGRSFIFRWKAVLTMQ